MCLESKTIFPKIAKKDIICYKVIDIENYSVFNKDYQYDEHKTNKASNFYELIIRILFYFVCRKKYLFIRYYSGILHSFSSKNQAQYLLYKLNKTDSYVIWECVIPKGSLYFEGHYNEYGSRKLKLVRKLC